MPVNHRKRDEFGPNCDQIGGAGFRSTGETSEFIDLRESVKNGPKRKLCALEGLW